MVDGQIIVDELQAAVADSRLEHMNDWIRTCPDLPDDEILFGTGAG